MIHLKLMYGAMSVCHLQCNKVLFYVQKGSWTILCLRQNVTKYSCVIKNVTKY